MNILLRSKKSTKSIAFFGMAAFFTMAIFLTYQYNSYKITSINNIFTQDYVRPLIAKTQLYVNQIEVASKANYLFIGNDFSKYLNENVPESILNNIFFKIDIIDPFEGVKTLVSINAKDSGFIDQTYKLKSSTLKGDILLTIAPSISFYTKFNELALNYSMLFVILGVAFICSIIFKLIYEIDILKEHNSELEKSSTDENLTLSTYMHLTNSAKWEYDIESKQLLVGHHWYLVQDFESSDIFSTSTNIDFETWTKKVFHKDLDYFNFNFKLLESKDAKTICFKFRVFTSFDEVKWCEVNASYIEHQSGKKHIVGWVRDIHDEYSRNLIFAKKSDKLNLLNRKSNLYWNWSASSGDLVLEGELGNENIFNKNMYSLKEIEKLFDIQGLEKAYDDKTDIIFESKNNVQLEKSKSKFICRAVIKSLGTQGEITSLSGALISLLESKPEVVINYNSDKESYKNLSVLIIEETKLNCKILNRHFVDLGVKNIDQCRKIHELTRISKSYDLVLVDYNMAQSSNLKISELNKLRKENSFIVATSTNNLTEKLYKDKGYNDFILKPAGLVSINRVLKDVLSDTDKNQVESVIDENEIMQCFSGDEDFLIEFIDAFLEKKDIYLTTILDAINTVDYKQLELTAHTLKGNCSNFYAKGIIELCQSIENDGHDQDITKCNDKFNLLSDKMKLLDSSLRDLQIKLNDKISISKVA